jgi:hypothetical protein
MFDRKNAIGRLAAWLKVVRGSSTDLRDELGS